MKKQLTFFDAHMEQRKINQIDPLVMIGKTVDFEGFRRVIEAKLKKEKKLDGRPSYDIILIVKMLILQTLYNLSDEQLEYQVFDRLSFLKFLGLTINDRVPDAKTVWHYREQFIKHEILDKIFATFQTMLDNRGYHGKCGQIVDATIINVPKQRNTKEEKEMIKNSQTPEKWLENKHKLSQKDLHARWMVKYKKTKDAKGQEHVLSMPNFGYKNHISIDCEHKFIRKIKITAANAYDGHHLGDLIDRGNANKQVYGDKAYGSKDNVLFARGLGFEPEMHEAGNKVANPQNSKIRSAVEHVFAVQKCQMKMGGTSLRVIGLLRVAAKITLANLVYNIKRLVFLETRVRMS